jgi:hypothetical protein
MTEQQTGSEPRKEDEESTFETEEVGDLDVPESEGEDVKGGGVGIPQKPGE